MYLDNYKSRTKKQLLQRRNSNRKHGVSQLSFNPKFFCTKCKKELKDVKAIQFNW